MAVLPSTEGGVRFPQKLHQLLEETEKNGQWQVISWLPDGKSFKVHDKEEFIRKIMPAYFDLTKYKSFQRNLNLWGFVTVPKGPEKGKCSNSYFLRGFPLYCQAMKRITIKGNGAKRSSSSSAACSRSSSFVVPQQRSINPSLSAAKQPPLPNPHSQLSQQVASQQQHQMASLADGYLIRLALQRLQEESALLLQAQQQQQQQQQRAADPSAGLVDVLLTQLLLLNSHSSSSSQQHRPQSSSNDITISQLSQEQLLALLARPELSSLLGAASLARI
jgi:hypothetical protein